MRPHPSYGVLYLLWIALFGAAAEALWTGKLHVAFIAVLTFGLTLTPFFGSRLLAIKLPAGFITAVALFLYATLFLGEAGNFYERFWWWDILLHTGSAIGIGLVGMVLMLILLRGEKITAAPITAAAFAFCFAITIGVFWEIFEFLMDWFFGLNMQKSGLVDTMTDLMVDCLGAGIGAIAGFLSLKRDQAGGTSALIGKFIEKNRRLFNR